MSKITKLTDIEIYQEAIKLARLTYALTRKTSLTRDFSLVDQLRRASLSVAANIAEGYGRKTKRDFAQFMSIALGSANEIMAYFDFIELEYKLETQSLKDKYDILAKRIFAFRSYLFNNS